MEQDLFIIFIVIAITSVAIIHAKMVLIWRDVEQEKLKRMKKEWCEVNKLYLHIVSKHNEQPIENVTYKQMQKRIKHHFKYNYYLQ